MADDDFSPDALATRITKLEIRQWIPGGEEHPTEVHLHLEWEQDGQKRGSIVRFGTKPGLLAFCRDLIRTSQEVWPEDEPKGKA